MPDAKDKGRTLPKGGEKRTSAQVEFDRYKARLSTPGGAAEPGGEFAPFPPSAGRPGPILPGWAFPPSLAALPGYPGSGGATGAQSDPAAVGGSVTERLGVTLRLGLDLINASLAGGTRLLSGLSGAAYGIAGAAAGAGGGCGCGGGCHGCASDPCGYDCCGALGSDPCCRPSVGTCGC